jgi:hypothetical protein
MAFSPWPALPPAADHPHPCWATASPQGASRHLLVVSQAAVGTEPWPCHCGTHHLPPWGLCLLTVPSQGRGHPVFVHGTGQQQVDGAGQSLARGSWRGRGQKGQQSDIGSGAHTSSLTWGRRPRKTSIPRLPHLQGLSLAWVCIRGLMQKQGSSASGHLGFAAGPAGKALADLSGFSYQGSQGGPGRGRPVGRSLDPAPGPSHGPMLNPGCTSEFINCILTRKCINIKTS